MPLGVRLMESNRWRSAGGATPPPHLPRPHSQQNNTHRFVPPTHGHAHKVGHGDSALNKQNSKAFCTTSSEVTPTCDLQGVSFSWLSVQMLPSAEEMSAIMLCRKQDLDLVFLKEKKKGPSHQVQPIYIELGTPLTPRNVT